MCTPPEWCDLPSLGKKGLGMGARQVGVRGRVLGLQLRGFGDGAAFRGWLVLSRQDLGCLLLHESQVTSGSMGSSVQSCCDNVSLSGCIASPLTLLGCCPTIN